MGQHRPFDASIIENIYLHEICGSKFSIRRIMMLELSQYLENYLWPNYKKGVSSHAHLMSIVVMVNEKFRERVETWKVFVDNDAEFAGFFQHVTETSLAETDITSAVEMKEQIALLIFLNHCFNSMEMEICRNQAKRLISLSMWACLQPSKITCFKYSK